MIHYASKPRGFKNNVNATKSKAFLFMSQNVREDGWDVATLASQLGLNRRSLAVLIIRWFSWGYVNRVSTGAAYRYSLSVKGITWLYKNEKDMPAERYLNEINEYRAKHG